MKKPLWAKITREERYFCSFLFHDIKQNREPFLKLLVDAGLQVSSECRITDIGFEVCYFRDGSKSEEDRPAVIAPFEEIIKRHEDKIRALLLENSNKNENFDLGQYTLSKINLIKQTYDLVLWLSDNSLVIIEAKAQQGFTNKQIDHLKIARVIILASPITEFRPRQIYLVALAGDPYLKKCRVKSRFDAHISWADVARISAFANKSLYSRADSLYGK